MYASSYIYVMGVIKMRNIVPRAGIEPTSLAFQASVLTIKSPRLADVTTVATATSIYDFPERSVQPTSRPPGLVSLLMLIITYIQAMTLHLHTQDRLNNYPSCGLHRIIVIATSGMGVMKMANIVPRVGIEPISLTFRANMPTVTPPRLPDLSTLLMPTCI